MSGFAFLVFAVHSLRASMPYLERHQHPPKHVYTKLLHSLLSFYPMFSSNQHFNELLIILSTNFTPHIDLTIALYALLKIAISTSLKHHVSIPYNMANLTQLGKIFPFIFNENLLPSNSSLIHPFLTYEVSATINFLMSYRVVKRRIISCI